MIREGRQGKINPTELADMVTKGRMAAPLQQQPQEEDQTPRASEMAERPVKGQHRSGKYSHLATHRYRSAVTKSTNQEGVKVQQHRLAAAAKAASMGESNSRNTADKARVVSRSRRLAASTPHMFEPERTS